MELYGLKTLFWPLKAGAGLFLALLAVKSHFMPNFAVF